MRTAAPADAAAIAAVHLRTALIAYAPIFPPEAPPPTLDEVETQWRSWLGDTATRVVVAERDTAIVGVVLAQPEWGRPGVGRFARLYVAPEMWAGGIGRQLHDAALDHLRDIGCREALLWVLEGNDRARSWYERLGWVLTGERRPVYVPAAIDDVEYRIVLDPSPSRIPSWSVETDEELESGYGRATPADDNLCNDYVQGMADGFLALAAARGDRVADDDDVAMADSETGSLFGNVAVLRRPIDVDAWPALAGRMHDFFAGRPGGAFLTFSAWPTPDLRALDFGPVGHPPLMVRPPGPIEVEPIDGFVIRPVTDAATAADFEFALVHGYPEPGLQPFVAGCFLPERALTAPGWHHWVGYLDGEPMATASAVLGRHHVDVEFISTMAAARGRGIGRAMTAAATLALPDQPAMLISSDDGNSVYRRLGYLPLLRFTLWAGHRR